MLFLILSVVSCITFLILTFFFTLKTVAKESILSSIFSNKIAFIVIYGIFTLIMTLSLALTYSMYDNIFPVWLMVFSLICLFCILLIGAIYIALKISRSSNLKIYHAPGSKADDIPTIIVVEDIMQTEDGITGEVLENVKFFPGTLTVKSFDYGDYVNEGGRPRKMFIQANKVHYVKDNVHYLKSPLIKSKDPRFDIEVSMMGFDSTKEMNELVEQIDYYRTKYYNIRSQVGDLGEAFKDMGATTKTMSHSMAKGVSQLLEGVNVQMKGNTNWERKAELERMGVSKKEMKRLNKIDRQNEELREKGGD